MQVPCDVQVRFLSPPEPLRRYFTSFYFAGITPPPGESVTDLLHPEWANLRFFSGALPDAGTKAFAVAAGRTVASVMPPASSA